MIVTWTRHTRSLQDSFMALITYGENHTLGTECESKLPRWVVLVNKQTCRIKNDG